MFIGRSHEIFDLNEEFNKNRSSLTVVYGRRRIGKTRLLREFCNGKSCFRFEGLETGTLQEQLRHFLKQLSKQTHNPIMAHLECATWNEAWEYLNQALPKKKKQVIIFDEFPWMINKDEHHVALFKYFWDNTWQPQNNAMIILCGSVNTFMVKKVITSSALYGRIHHEIQLSPLSPKEVGLFFSNRRTPKEIVDLYMVFGGIPKYLEEISSKESTIQNINRLCFTKNAFFVNEFERLFKDEFGKHTIYKKIVRLLARYSNLNYSELMNHLKTTIGGGYHDYLDNLKLAGFIEAYTPLHKTETQLIRYRLIDEYLLFYFNMIEPNRQYIEDNDDRNLFLTVLGKHRWSIWSGFAFERFCRKQTKIIQKKLNIDQLVKAYGPYFTRRTTNENGLQIDLLFERHDKVTTLCEVKYTERPIGQDIIESIEKKITILKLKKNQSIERVLITAQPPSKTLLDRNYFHHIITLQDLI